VKSSFDGLYLARTPLLFPAHEGFLRSMIGEFSSALAMTSVSLTKSSHMNFLIWCLMAIVEGSLIFFQTDACALRTPVAALVDQVKLLLIGAKSRRAPDLRETHLRQTRKDPIFGCVWKQATACYCQ
jgi:hypothetical protein